MAMPRLPLSVLVLVLLAGAVTVVPLWLSWGTVGDGAAWQYAMETGDYSGLRDWLLGGYWVLAWGLVVLAQWADQIGVGLSLLVRLSDTVLLIGLVVECRRWCIEALRMPEGDATGCAVLMLIIGPWYVLVNHFAVTQLLCLYLGFVGTRCLSKGSLARRLLGLLLATASFQLTSNILFLTALQTVRILKTQESRRSLALWSLALFACGALSFVILRWGLPRSPLHADYNNILLPTTLDNLTRVFRAAVMFATWLAVPLAGATMLMCVGRIRPKRLMPGPATSISPGLLVSLFLCGAAVFSHVAVGKGFALFFPTAMGNGLTEQVIREAYAGWPLAPTFSSSSARHAMTLAFPLALLSVSLAFQLRSRISSQKPLFWILLALPGLAFSVGGSWNRLQQIHAQDSLKAGLTKLPAPPPGLVEIHYRPATDWIPTIPESNLIARGAWGSSAYMTMTWGSEALHRDLYWQYHAYYRRLQGKINERTLQGMQAMSEFPGVHCASLYTAVLPSPPWWRVLLGAVMKDTAEIALQRSDCQMGRELPNPTPDKVPIL